MHVLGDLLGEGQMGRVFAARGPNGEEVAIKVLHAALSRNAEISGRFEREARIGGMVASPFIASVVAAGRSAAGELWIAFERLQGESLRARLLREHCLAAPVVATLLGHVMEGLRVIHEAGVAHRDIKPANIFIETTGRARILDFGVAKYTRRAVDDTATPPTALGETLGTFDYIPPEQLDAAASVDERADLYAAAVVAFRALTGVVPFLGPTLQARIAFKTARDARSLSAQTGLEWPSDIEQFFGFALARHPDSRYSSARHAMPAWHAIDFGRCPAQHEVHEATRHLGHETES